MATNARPHVRPNGAARKRVPAGAPGFSIPGRPAGAGPQDGERIPTCQEAAKRFGFEQSVLYDWHVNGCRYLSGEKLKGHQEMRPVAKGNGLREIWVYNLAPSNESTKSASGSGPGSSRTNKACGCPRR
jgi:hypothetical protein